MENLITEHIDIWTSAQEIKIKGGRGRGKNSNGQSLHGIKKLRELILELAVRGKLVPQDPNDEPATILLDKIAKEKTRLIKERKIRKQKKLPEVTEDEELFKLPEGWEWTRLESISQINPRNEAPDNLEVSFIPMPLITTSHTGQHDQEKKIWGKIKKGYTHFADGDVGIAKITPCFENGKGIVLTGLKNGIGAGTTELHIARPFSSTLASHYILLFLKAPMFLHVGKSKMTGTAGQKRVPKAFFSESPFPLPPFAEQSRIVSKVDELMAICDQMEQQQTDSNTAHQTLVETLLAALTNVFDHDEFVKAWGLISEHFDTLFTTEQSIDQLKQTILQLAVMGKLVPQDLNDEPASVLLDTIVTGKDRLIKEKKIKKQKKPPKVSEAEKPFEIPSSWAYSRIGDASLFTEYGMSEKTFDTIDGIPVLKMGDIQYGKVILGGQKRVRKNVESLPSLYLKNGDLLYNRTNSAELVGKTGLYNGPNDTYTFASYLVRIRCPKKLLNPHFFNLSMNTPLFRSTQIEPHLKQQCGQANVNATIMRNMIITVPPLKEQNRIVAKVNELMAFCDKLKSSLKESQETQVLMADSILYQVVA